MSAGHTNFDWARYIAFAKDLLTKIPEGEDDECKVRCGISRAYYGVFHRAKEYLDHANIDYDPYHEGSHEKLIDEFQRLGKGGNREYSVIFMKLGILKKLRIKADYHNIFFEPLQSTSNGALRSKLKMMLDEVDRTVKAIESIENKESD